MAANERSETDPVPRLLRRRPPAAALEWAAAPFGPGSQVVSVRPLASAWLANHVVEVADAAGARHRVVLRRWARPGWDEEDPDFDAAREAAILELLAGTPVPAPALVAGDPGRLVEGLAAALPPIHAVAVPGPGVVPAYHRFYEPDRLTPPAWSDRPALWARAFEVAAGPPPPGPSRFIHRDYHPGNTLWERGRVSGVVDWIGGSLGPPGVDLGHMRVNLAPDLGLEVADRFLAAHQALTGLDHHPFWDVASAVDVAPAEAPAAWRGVEDLVAAALARLGGPG